MLLYPCHSLAQLHLGFLAFNSLHFYSSSYLPEGYSVYLEPAPVPPHPINLPATASYKAVLHTPLKIVIKYTLTGSLCRKFNCH